jgi:hypothetical protein
LHKELAERVSEEKLRAYLALYELEPPVFAAKEMDELLRRRFGDEGAGEIWDAYHDTWVTKTDFQVARALGFNFARVPFWYRWFEEDDEPYGQVLRECLSQPVSAANR